MNKSKQIKPCFLFTAHKHTLNLLLKIAVYLSVHLSHAHKVLTATPCKYQSFRIPVKGTDCHKRVLGAETVEIQKAAG